MKLRVELEAVWKHCGHQGTQLGRCEMVLKSQWCGEKWMDL